MNLNVMMFFFQMLSFMHAQATFFHQGHDLYDDNKEYMDSVSDQVSMSL